jgi:type IV pilus secretin PilQ/predicted competence protein
VLIIVGCAPSEVKKVDTTPPKEGVAPSRVKVSKITTEALVGKMRITIDADSELTYTAFKLTDPLRLVLDLPNVDTTQVSEMTFAGTSPLMRITPFQFVEGNTVNSRIEVALSRLVPYQVFSDAHKLFIDLEVPVEEITTAHFPSSPSLPPGFEELTPAQKESPLVIESKPGVVPSIKVESKLEKAPLVSPGTPGFQPGVSPIEITRPPETVGGITPLPGTISESSVVTNMEISEVDGKTRIILYTDKIPEFDVKRSEAPARLTMDLKKTDLPPGAEKVIAPEDLETLVKRVRLFQLRRTPDGTDNVVRVLVDLMKPAEHEVITEPGKLILDIKHPTTLAKMSVGEGEGITDVPLTTGIEAALKEGEKGPGEEEVAPAPTIRAPKTGEEKEYKGQLISIHFQDADILDVLDVIAEVSGLNLVVHPGVGGRVTVRLENIPWDQALDIILKMNNLNVNIEGNILRVAPATVFQAEIDQRVEQQRKQIEARKVQEELEPLETKLITVNFAEPGSIVSLIDQYFQGAIPPEQRERRRGTITVDNRTKTLIIQDTAENIKKIEEIVATLDRRTPQVMIEARIVSLSSLFRKELGINWGGRFSAGPQYGNALDYRFPYTIDMPAFGVNLPSVGNPVGTTGRIVFGSIDDVLSIFARIDAAEEDNKAKTLAQPKIFTQDNVGATVSSGQTQYVPIGGDSQTAASLQAVTATLSLNVTPRISRDGYITMIVSVTNDSIQTGAGGIPTTNNQSVNSQITVKDGETVVIGGVFQTAEIKNFTAVPYLHKIPLIGRLFKSNLPNSQTQTELLVFLTPRILDRSVLKPEQESTNVSLAY